MERRRKIDRWAASGSRLPVRRWRAGPRRGVGAPRRPPRRPGPRAGVATGPRPGRSRQPSRPRPARLGDPPTVVGPPPAACVGLHRPHVDGFAAGRDPSGAGLGDRHRAARRAAGTGRRPVVRRPERGRGVRPRRAGRRPPHRADPDRSRLGDQRAEHRPGRGGGGLGRLQPGRAGAATPLGAAASGAAALFDPAANRHEHLVMLSTSSSTNLPSTSTGSSVSIGSAPSSGGPLADLIRRGGTAQLVRLRPAGQDPGPAEGAPAAPLDRADVIDVARADQLVGVLDDVVGRIGNQYELRLRLPPGELQPVVELGYRGVVASASPVLPIPSVTPPDSSTTSVPGGQGQARSVQPRPPPPPRPRPRPRPPPPVPPPRSRRPPARARPSRRPSASGCPRPPGHRRRPPRPTGPWPGRACWWRRWSCCASAPWRPARSPGPGQPVGSAG